MAANRERPEANKIEATRHSPNCHQAGERLDRGIAVVGLEYPENMNDFGVRPRQADRAIPGSKLATRLPGSVSTQRDIHYPFT